MKQTEIFICECHSHEHQLQFWYDPEEDLPDFRRIHTVMHLTTHRNFFQRLKYAWKYLFGYKCRYGAWDEFIFSSENEEKLKEFLINKD